jgi:hypothetical protein
MSGINCRKKLLSTPVEVMALLVTFIKFLSELLLAFVFDSGEKNFYVGSKCSNYVERKYVPKLHVFSVFNGNFNIHFIFFSYI